LGIVASGLKIGKDKQITPSVIILAMSSRNEGSATQKSFSSLASKGTVQGGKAQLFKSLRSVLLSPTALLLFNLYNNEEFDRDEVKDAIRNFPAISFCWRS